MNGQCLKRSMREKEAVAALGRVIGGGGEAKDEEEENSDELSAVDDVANAVTPVVRRGSGDASRVVNLAPGGGGRISIDRSPSAGISGRWILRPEGA